MVLHIYSSFSKFYSLLALKRPVQKEIRFLDSLLRKNRVNGLVIDIGCGHGVHAHGLSEKGYSVLAVDNSKEQLTLAKKLFSDLQTVQADMIDFVMPENASMVYSLFATIMYAPNVFAVKKVCTNAYVTLRKNGVYVLELPPSLHQIKKYPYQYKVRSFEKNRILFFAQYRNIDVKKRSCLVDYYLFGEEKKKKQMYTDTFPSTLLTAKDYAKLLKKIGFRKVYYYNKWSLQSKTLFPRKYKTKVIVAKK